MSKAAQVFFYALIVIALPQVSMAASGKQGNNYSLEYRVKFLPESGDAAVTLTLKNAARVSAFNFNLKGSQCRDFKSPQKLESQKDNRLVWVPGKSRATLTYTCKINHPRKSQNGGKVYDAYMGKQWALFRGDDLVPPARVKAKKNTRSEARLVFELPPGWHSVNTGWQRDLSVAAKGGQKNAPVFLIDNPERSFDRPTGWIIAGDLGTRRDFFGELDSKGQPLKGTTISVSGPQDAGLRKMDILTFVGFAWPQVVKAFGTVPDKLLIVGAGEPMWRGGLSAGNSFYLHADRPLVSENGTSTLLHELIHLVTRISGEDNADWIAEGIAEFYAIELLYRAGGITRSRYLKIYDDLANWSRKVKRLDHKHSSGEVTAAAVILMRALNDEIRTVTANRYSLDDVVQQLMIKRKVSLADLQAAVEKLQGSPSKTLAKSPLLRQARAAAQQ